MTTRFEWAHGVADLVPRERSAISGLVVHRIEVSQEDPTYADTPAEVARFFREHPIGKQATGGAMPYPLLIDAGGTLTQTVPLLRITPHARSHNPRTIGVGLLGDFRTRAPAQAQRDTLVRVLMGLARALDLSPQHIHGHDELAQGSVDPDKECPGRHLQLPLLRDEVARRRDEVILLDLVW